MSSMFLLTRDEKIITSFNTHRSPLISDESDETLNGPYTFRFTLPYDSNDIDSFTSGHYVLLREIKGDYQLFEIVETKEEHDERHVKTCYLEHASTALNDYIIRDRRVHHSNAKTALERALEETDWKVGVVESEHLSSVTFFDETVRDALRKIIETWRLEIKYRVEVSGRTITGKYIDLLKKRGENRGIRLSYGRNTEKIERTIDLSHLKTAMIGRGRGEELEEGRYGRRLTFKAINDGKDYVEDLQALELWGRYNKETGQKEHRFGLFEDPDEDNEEILLLKTEIALERASQPMMSYDVDFYAGDMMGDGDDQIAIGDEVLVIDRSFIPELKVVLRAIRIKRSYSDLKRVHVTLGNLLPRLDSEDDLVRLKEMVSQRAGIWDQFGRGDIKIVAENGEVMLDTYGIDSRFIKYSQNLIWNSSFERYHLMTGIPEFWSGGVTSMSERRNSQRSLRLPVGEMSEQVSGTGGENPRPDPLLWDYQKTRVSFYKKGGDVQVSVFSEYDWAPYLLTAENGIKEPFYNTGISDDWDDGRYTFSFEPTDERPGRIWLRFTTIGGSEAYIDEVQMTPDFTGRYPQFYSHGPRSLSEEEMPLSHTWLENINIPYQPIVTIQFNRHYAFPPTITAALLRNMKASNEGSQFGYIHATPNIDLIINEVNGFLQYQGAVITWGGTIVSTENLYISVQIVGRT